MQKKTAVLLTRGCSILVTHSQATIVCHIYVCIYSERENYGAFPLSSGAINMTKF